MDWVDLYLGQRKLQAEALGFYDELDPHRARIPKLRPLDALALDEQWHAALSDWPIQASDTQADIAKRDALILQFEQAMTAAKAGAPDDLETPFGWEAALAHWENYYFAAAELSARGAVLDHEGAIALLGNLADNLGLTGELIGQVVGDLARGAGKAAGNALDKFLEGAGPIVVLVLLVAASQHLGDQ